MSAAGASGPWRSDRRRDVGLFHAMRKQSDGLSGFPVLIGNRLKFMQMSADISPAAFSP